MINLFKEQVEKNPNSVVVMFREDEVTHGELNSRANQMTHYLRSLGVKEETLVGIRV